MSIPLDRLYHYIESIAEEVHGDSIVIYHFYPHGSKNIEDIIKLRNQSGWWKFTHSPHVICHDQEPLNFEYYAQYEGNVRPRRDADNGPTNGNIYDKIILLHSELRSPEVDKYKNIMFVPVYYWSHALIALDWFRFGQHINQKKQIDRKFLIYNRAWSGTREYRLAFADRLIKLGLVNSCQMSCNPTDPELGEHYELHHFKNPVWKPTNVLEKYFPISNAHSHYSADFDLHDYETTDIEIVLETLFDDTRLHLTEKTLRPIACGQPFILAGTHGSLEYLRRYGFKTFGHIWDESYDMIENPEKRLNAITNLMRCIDNWDQKTYVNKMLHAQKIVEYNKQHFFSGKFFNQVTGELYNNLKTGLDEIENTNTGLTFINHRKNKYQITGNKTHLLEENKGYSRQDLVQALLRARQYYLRSLKHNS